MNTPERRRDQLRRDIVGATAYAMTQGGRGVMGDLLVSSLKTLGKPYTEDEVADAIEYLARKGLLTEVPNKVSAFLKIWKLTSEGIEWAEREGLA